MCGGPMEDTDVLRGVESLPANGWLPGDEPDLHEKLLRGQRAADSLEIAPAVPEKTQRMFLGGLVRSLVSDYGADGTRNILNAMGWPCPCCGDAPTPDSCGTPSHPCRLKRHGTAR